MSIISLHTIDKDFHSITSYQGGTWTIDSITNAVTIQDGGNSITVDGTVGISGTVAVTQSTSPWVIGDGGGSITVDATSLDIRALTSADQVTIANASIAVTQSTSPWVVSGTVNAVPAGFSSWLASADAAVAATATQLLSSPLSGRVKVEIQNIGAKDIRLAEANTVSSSKGVLVPKGTSYEVELGAGSALWAIGIGGTSTVTLAEFAA